MSPGTDRHLSLDILLPDPTAEGRAETGQGGEVSVQRETHLGGVILELCTLRLPGGLGLGKLLLKLSQTAAFILEQPAQLLECHLHVGQCLNVLIGLQTGARPGSGAFRGATRGAWAGNTHPKSGFRQVPQTL